MTIIDQIMSWLRHPASRWILAAIVLCTTCLFAVTLYLASGRYYLIQTEGRVYEIDRYTGRTWLIVGAGKVKVSEIEVSKSEKPTPEQGMPSDVLSKVTGQLGIRRPTGGYFEGKIYNGTDWYIKELTVEITSQPAGGEQWTRTFKVRTGILPFTSDEIYVDSAESRQIEKHTWRILSVKGDPPE